MKPLTIPLLLWAIIGCMGPRKAQADLSANLLAYWPFDDNTADLMGRHHAIPMSDSVILKEGKFGKAVSFDGEAESYLDILNATDSDLELVGSSKTVSIWISPNQLQSGGNAAPFSRRGVWFWEVYYNPVSESIGYYADVARSLPKFSTALEDGKWAHVVCVSDGDNDEDRIFFNGDLVSVGTFIDASPRYNDEDVKRRMHIGRSANERDRPWSGLVDDVAVWDRVLTSDEVATLWNEGEGRSLGSAHPDVNANALPDFWEAAYALDDASEKDADGDGYSNLEEYQQGTNPMSRDSDGDGLSDSVETGTGVWKDASDTGTSPYLTDSDADGLPDFAEDPSLPYIELEQPGSDPNLADSDGDGLTDGDEFIRNADPTTSAPDNLKYLTGLVAYWSFDDSLEASRSFENVDVRTEMSNANSATLARGKFGKGVLLDGLAAVTATALDPDGNDLFAFPKQSFSISGWWKSTSFNGIQNGLIASGGEHPWYLVQTADALLFHPSTADAVTSNLAGIEVSGDGFPEELLGSEQLFGLGSFEVTDGSLTLDCMHHIVSVYNSRTGQFDTYLDSVKLGTGTLRTSGAALRTDRLWIGSSFGRDFWQGTIDDVAIWSRTLSQGEIDTIYSEGRGRPLSELLSEDTDGDGMTDDWETAYGLDPLADDRAPDLDGDGLSNVREFELRTFPNHEDSDEDGLSDLVETLTAIWVNEFDTGTDPLTPDTDGDSFLDGFEISEYGTNPNLLDSDGDGLSDPTEVSIGSDPNDPSSAPNLATGLKAYWPFDGDLLDRQAALHGIARGSEPLTFVETDRGKGVYLNGISQYIEIQDSTEDFDFVDQSFSVSLWYTPETYEGLDIRKPSDKPLNIRRAIQATIVGKGGGFDRGYERSEDTWSIERSDEFSYSEQLGKVTTQSEEVIYESTIRQMDFHDPKDQFLMNQSNHLLLVVDTVAKEQRFYLNGKRIGFSKTLRRLAPNAVPLMIGVNPNETQRDFFRTRPGILHPYLRGVVDDVAIWDRPLADTEVEVIANSNLEIEALLGRPDKDNDGIDDTWEVLYGLDTELDDRNSDLDADGLTNLEEYALRTDPTNNDTDGDGLIDRVETASGRWFSLSDTGTDPLRIDTDGDGYSDGVERPDLGYASVIQPGTDPNVKDTDGDGAPDGEEGAAGTDPTNKDQIPSEYQVTAEWGYNPSGHDRLTPIIHARWEEDYPKRWEIDTYAELRETLEFKQTYTLPAINFASFFGFYVLQSSEFSTSDRFLGPSKSERFPNNLEFVAQEEGPNFDALFMRVTGTFKVTTPGEWTFGMSASLGGDLRINGERIAHVAPVCEGIRINTCDFDAASSSVFGTVNLTAGTHQIDLYVWHYLSFDENWKIFAEVSMALERGKFEAFDETRFVLLRPYAASTPVESELIVQEVERNSAGVRIQWVSEPGSRYNVEYSRTLNGPWEVIAQDLEASSIQTSWSDTDPERLRSPSGFYRVGLATKDL